MSDREKVINGLFEMVVRDTWKDIDPYRSRYQPILNDALALLKKQEPKPVKNIDDSEVGIRSGFCPECQKLIYYNILHPAEFCKYCGQAVKWNEG